MSDNALTVATSGQDIPASHHNELVTALLQNIVPRNASRIAEDLAGSLGTSALRWLRAYVETYHIGTASANLTIFEGAPGEIHVSNPNGDLIKVVDGGVQFWTNSVKRFEVNDSGINWAIMADNSIPLPKVDGIVFNNRISTYHVINDTGGVLATMTELSLVCIEPVSNFDIAGGGMHVRVPNVANAPTTYNGDTTIFKWPGTVNTFDSYTVLVQPGKQVVIDSGDFTARFYLHILQLR